MLATNANIQFFCYRRAHKPHKTPTALAGPVCGACFSDPGPHWLLVRSFGGSGLETGLRRWGSHRSPAPPPPAPGSANPPPSIPGQPCLPAPSKPTWGRSGSLAPQHRGCWGPPWAPTTHAPSPDSFIKPPAFPIPLFLTSVSVSD